MVSAATGSLEQGLGKDAFFDNVIPSIHLVAHCARLCVNPTVSGFRHSRNDVRHGFSSKALPIFQERGIIVQQRVEEHLFVFTLGNFGPKDRFDEFRF